MKLTDKEKKQIIADYKECKNYNEVARRNHRDRTTVKRALLSVEKTIENTAQKNGRPKIEFTEKDWEQIKELCNIQCTAEEIASVMGYNADTIGARIREKHSITFSQYIKIHAMGGKASLRRMQFNLAKTNAGMAIFLGKQYLGQKDYIPDDADSEKLEKLINAISEGTK